MRDKAVDCKFGSPFSRSVVADGKRLRSWEERKERVIQDSHWGPRRQCSASVYEAACVQRPHALRSTCAEVGMGTERLSTGSSQESM